MSYTPKRISVMSVAFNARTPGVWTHICGNTGTRSDNVTRRRSLLQLNSLRARRARSYRTPVNLSSNQMEHTDEQTPYGPVRKVHLQAAWALYKDILQRTVEPQVLFERGRKLSDISPAAATILQFWLESALEKRVRWADLAP